MNILLCGAIILVVASVLAYLLLRKRRHKDYSGLNVRETDDPKK